MDKIITIVVPVYKVEQYINKCLESLVVPHDLMEKLEVIVVNDGTPDNSAIMAKEMGADHSLAGQLVVWTSVLSLVTLFILVFVLKVIGWL